MSSANTSPIETPARAITTRATLFLYVHAGGRCEFDGCPKFLLEHQPTETPGNFGERAHIYAFKESAARGSEPGRPPGSEISEIDNLILLCPECHHLVDTVNPGAYPVCVLKTFKKEHEDRIRELTALASNPATVPLVMRGLVDGRAVDISAQEMQSAAAPSIVKRGDTIEIDLTNIPDRPDPAFWATAVTAIDDRVAQLYRLSVPAGESFRVSVFGLGPIPLLVYLGAKLSDKFRTDLYQLHRAPETWTWQAGDGETRFVTRSVSPGAPGGPVVLLVNLSGRNDATVLPTTLASADPTIYEITLEGADPTPLCLRTRGDLDRFTREYLNALAAIRAGHDRSSPIHLFPAVPAPAAITLGRSRLSKVDARLLVYDYDARAGGFVHALEIP